MALDPLNGGEPIEKVAVILPFIERHMLTYLFRCCRFDVSTVFYGFIILDIRLWCKAFRGLGRGWGKWRGAIYGMLICRAETVETGTVDFAVIT